MSVGGRLDPTTASARRLVAAGLSDLQPGDTVLVGLSGGADSLALASVLSFVAVKESLRAGAIVVDHRLQAGSEAACASAAGHARTLGLDPVEIVRVDVGRTGGPEAAARDARRSALNDAALRHGALAVLLAHTRDDQAETVLLGLARGSGPRSIAGMARLDGLWRRPFLTLARTQTQAICTAAGLTWWEDPQNADPSFARVRVRTAMPRLEAALGPGVAEALARTADLVRADADLLDSLAVLARADVTLPDGRLRVDRLKALPDALRTRVIRAAALRAGCPAQDLAMVHVIELDRLVRHWHGQTRVELPRRVVATRSDGLIGFTRSRI